VLEVYGNCVLYLMKKREVTLYICSIHSATQFTLFTAVFVESLNFLPCNLKRWPTDVSCLAKARMCCLVMPDDISNGVAVDECEVILK